MNEFTDKQIEQAAQQHAAELALPPFFTPDAEATIRDIAKSSYTYGAQDALASQWVSVEERKPDSRQLVLISDDDGYISLATWNERYKCWEDKYGDEVFYGREGVKFWMEWPPIPLLNPEKKKDEHE